jgi:cell division protein FtsB
MFDKDVGANWHLRFRLKLEELQKENEKLKLKNKILERKIKKYENNNTRTTWNREDNNTIKSR